MNWTNTNNFFTDKRNVLSHFLDLHIVTVEGRENGKVRKVSPKDVQKKTAEGQNVHLRNGSQPYVYH